MERILFALVEHGSCWGFKNSRWRLFKGRSTARGVRNACKCLRVSPLSESRAQVTPQLMCNYRACGGKHGGLVRVKVSQRRGGVRAALAAALPRARPPFHRPRGPDSRSNARLPRKGGVSFTRATPESRVVLSKLISILFSPPFFFSRL